MHDSQSAGEAQPTEAASQRWTSPTQATVKSSPRSVNIWPRGWCDTEEPRAGGTSSPLVPGTKLLTAFMDSFQTLLASYRPLIIDMTIYYLNTQHLIAFIML